MTINIGLLGLGNVGSGVAKGLMEGRVKGAYLKGVLVRQPGKYCDAEGVKLTIDPHDILRDPDIHVVVELMGGLEPARTYVLDAIKAGKSVVTANKNVIAKYGKEVFDAARGRVDVGYEASVGGGIQINHVLKRIAPSEKVRTVQAIINGTTNYLLTRLYEGVGYETSLAEAQEKGYAEPDPTYDISGLDARDKLAVLAMQVYNAEINPDDIYCEGLDILRNLPAHELRRAQRLGYVMKMLAIAKEHSGCLELRVHPTFIRETHPLAAISGVENAICWEGELCGPQMYRGRGAGKDPTASAVLSDISRIAANLRKGVVDDLPTLDTPVAIIDKHKVRISGYIRADLNDVPGTLHQLTGITTRNNISIAQVLQRDEDVFVADGKTYGRAAITTYPVECNVLEQLMKEVKSLDYVAPEPFLLKLEM